MSRSRRARVDTLKKRADFLSKRIDDGFVVGRDLTFDKAERNAICWALPILEGHIEANKVLQEQLREGKNEKE